MKLAYRAFEKTGREITDVIEASSVEEATDRLRQQELFIAGAESRGAPGEGRSSRGDNGRDGKKQGQGGNPQPERRTARRGRRRCWL